MADWKVSPEIVEVKTHPNADKLDVLKVGNYQLVAGKGNYQDGDVVIIIPEKSVIPEGPILEEFKDYLVGKDKNRVKAIRLRGEVSEAITWPLHRLDELFDSGSHPDLVWLSLGQDISEALGIHKYEPPTPQQLRGIVKPIEGFPYTRKHDAHHYASYADEFAPDEWVLITEKIHGSQVNYFYSFEDGREVVTSKGLLKKGLVIEKNEHNAYWQGVWNSDLRGLTEYLARMQPRVVQFIGELMPVQKGFSYGCQRPQVRLFEVVLDGESMPMHHIPDAIQRWWVPILHEGFLNEVDLQALSRGKERVSGNSQHIREGIVVKPYKDRKAHDGKRLHLKILNPKYKDNDEEVN